MSNNKDNLENHTLSNCNTMFIMMAKQNFIYKMLRITYNPDKIKCFPNTLHSTGELEQPCTNWRVPVCASFPQRTQWCQIRLVPVKIFHCGNWQLLSTKASHLSCLLSTRRRLLMKCDYELHSGQTRVQTARMEHRLFPTSPWVQS